MHRTQITILKQSHQMRLRRFLQRENGTPLPPVRMAREVHLDFSDEAGEGEAADEEVCGMLIGSYFS